MSQHALRTVLAAIAIAALPIVATAQWSSDPSNNLVLADRGNEQVQPKLVATSDGGFYVSWFDNSSGGYDVYLQRLDASGDEQWAHNGVLVANRDLSSTQDYGLDIDADGNALLAFGYNDNGGIMQVLAQKVAPDGTLLWGDPGIFLSDRCGRHGCAEDLRDGRRQRRGRRGRRATELSSCRSSIANGNPLWGRAGVSIAPSAGFILPRRLARRCRWQRDRFVGRLDFTSPTRECARRNSRQSTAATSGAPIRSTVYDGTDGALQFGNFPPFIADGAGGAVFVWYTVATSGSVHVQHVDATGAPLFAQNGVLASTNTTRAPLRTRRRLRSGERRHLRALARDRRDADARSASTRSASTTRARCNGAMPARCSLPLSPNDQTQMVALPVAGGGMLAAWASNDAPNPMPIHVARLDTAGNYVWAAQVVDITTEANDVGRLTGALSSAGYAAYAWTANAGELRRRHPRAEHQPGRHARHRSARPDLCRRLRSALAFVHGRPSVAHACAPARAASTTRYACRLSA